MSKFIIQGGFPLKGAVHLGGAKNASFKLMIASLLVDGETRLLNFSHIGDVAITKKIIESLGGEVKSCGERTLFINAKSISSFEVPENLARQSRASTIFVGPLLSRFSKAILPLPGGDKIGPRPLERHFKGLEKLGAKIRFINGRFEASCKTLKGVYYRFEKNSHTGTETLIMAAAKAIGKTVIDNAAQEPEVDDLINFLNSAGAKIKRKKRRIEIEGVKRLTPTIYSIMPDRNEAVTYACAALGTKGDIIVENAKKEHLKAFLEKLDEIGGGYEFGNYGIRFFYQKQLRATDVKTASHPGFMTDWQPLWTTLMTQAKGESRVIETIFPNRLGFTEDLIKMGAEISLYNPKVAHQEKFYNFNLEDDKKDYFHAAKISGPTKLRPIKVKISDLRAGATLVLAALIARGKSILTNIGQITRGYENLDGRLIELGAKIRKV